MLIKNKTNLNNEKNRFLLFLVCIGSLLTAPLFSGILFLTLLLISPKKKINYFIKKMMQKFFSKIRKKKKS